MYLGQHADNKHEAAAWKACLELDNVYFKTMYAIMLAFIIDLHTFLFVDITPCGYSRDSALHSGPPCVAETKDENKQGPSS
jgi:hypothetical protein